MDDVWTIGRLITWMSGFFAEKGSESARLDGEVLLASVLDCRRIDLYAMWEAEVAEPDRRRLRELVKGRAAGCPVAYLVGSREFFSLDFEVGPGVLIPRPETELLVGEAIAFLRGLDEPRFLDVGTGSGCVAVAVAKEVPAVAGLAIDRSPEAIAIAQRNAERHGVADRVRFVEADLFAGLDTEPPVDLVVSNPPYVTTGEWEALPRDVRDFEPRLALDAGAEGLDVIGRLVAESGDRVREGGRLLFEISPAQAVASQELIDGRPEWRFAGVQQDAARRPRLMRAERVAV